LRPAAQYAAEVIAPPYDVLNTTEARRQAASKPWSFLHISKAEIDLDENIDPYSPLVYQQAAKNLQSMLEAGVLLRDPGERYYVYRIREGEHVQIGLVAIASLAAYGSNRIRKHENTLPTKEQDRVRQIDALNAQTGPVLLAYPDCADIDSVLAEETRQPPAMLVTDDHSIEHALWVISDTAKLAALTDAFEQLPALYIADGHHRSAAAAAVAAKRAAAEDSAEHYFLSVIFPKASMQILDYNRVVKDLNGLTEAQFLDALAATCVVENVSVPTRPHSKGQFSMYLAGRWYRLSQRLAPANAGEGAGKSASAIAATIVANLDTSRLTDTILHPILGIEDLRRDSRIAFVGGRRGLDELARLVDSGEMAVGFALLPTTMSELLAVADSGEIMPPKSTWFEPKLADGVVSHVLD